MLHITKFYTQSQNTKTHDDLLAGHHPGNDSSQHGVVIDKCDEGLGEISIAGNVHWDTAMEDWSSFTKRKRTVF